MEEGPVGFIWRTRSARERIGQDWLDSRRIGQQLTVNRQDSAGIRAVAGDSWPLPPPADQLGRPPARSAHL